MAEKSIVEHFQSSCVLVEKCLRNLDSKSYESMIGDAMGWSWRSIFKRIKPATPRRMELGVVAQRKRPTSGLEEKQPFASTEALNECSDDKFAPLSRVEGGFMCVYGAGFSSTEGLYDHLSENPQQNQPVRKAIRFGRLHGRRVDWPSDFYDVKPDTEIIQGGDTIFVLRFEGQNCRPWTKRQRALYEGIIARTLRWQRTMRRPWQRTMRRP